MSKTQPESSSNRRGVRVTLACGAKFLYTLKGWPRATFYCPKCGKTCRTKDVQPAVSEADVHAMEQAMKASALRPRKEQRRGSST